MSTRAVYTFVDNDGPEIHVYKHHDGYPEGEHGAICTIGKALKYAWPLPRFEADEFAASFVASAKVADNDSSPAGGVRLLNGGRDVFPGDIAYHYVVTTKDGELFIECRYPGNAKNKHTGALRKRGTLAEMKAWAMKGAKPAKTMSPGKPVIEPVNEAGDHRTHSLPPHITAPQIQKVLGFKANIDDDNTKVKHSWGFTVNGKRAGIWDYKGSRWSVYDPEGVVAPLFAHLTEKV